MAPAKKFWTVTLTVLAIAGLLTGAFLPISGLARVQAATKEEGTTSDNVRGPFIDQTTPPAVYNGDLRDLPQSAIDRRLKRRMPNPVPTRDNPRIGIENWVDPVAQESFAQGQMPEPIANFAGLGFNPWGAGWPPDTNGDVGPNHYIQSVNTSVGIFDKTTGALIIGLTLDDFFQGPAGTPCDNLNAGDPVVFYDEQVDRWVVTDFAWVNFNTGPFYECIAVSQTGDPVSGGWYYYALRADTGNLAGYLNDYPKLAVGLDGWYMTANMFGNGFAVRVWALDRNDALIGDPLSEVHFDCTDLTYCASMLPANIRGDLAPAGSPEYFADVMMPNSFNIWEFHVDWTTPGNSTFTGPTTIQVADFQMADSVPQFDSTELLDSLGDRMMFQLQYRNINGTEALFATHSVLTHDANGNEMDAIRWYEVRDPGGTPALYQQGTYAPDSNYRWMGSIAADAEGNIAVGYSVSSTTMRPAIRYAGRLAGEVLGQLTQNEAVLIQGTGSQQGGYSRWGDYSTMSIDPVDQCTFWYTQEYYVTKGSNWQTRIGSFKFPSCGVEKGVISGFVYNSATNQPVAGVPVFAVGASYNYTTLTNEAGFYKMTLIDGSYDLTAGPLLPGYPTTDIANGVVVVAPDTTQQDFYLDPVPSLVHDQVTLADPNGNGNGFPEPGEQGLQLSESLYNQGATTSTGITSQVTSLTAGVTVTTADSTYADIAAGSTGTNATPYVFSIDPNLACGTEMQFEAVITDSVYTYNTAFSLNASTPLPRQDVFFNDVEGGAAGWTTGGSPNSWAITANQSHSPTHSWTDSPSGNYGNNANNWVRTPAYDLSGKRHVQLEGWFKYALEAGWDYAYVEYSLNGGNSWNANPLAIFNAFEDWHLVTIDASVLDNQANVALRIRMKSDTGVVEDGIYVDDVALSYEPFECNYTPVPNAPTLVSPADGSWVSSPVTFTWEPGVGGAPAEGYIFYIDDTPVVTFTTPVTTVTLDVTPWAHTWFVKATSASGVSLPSETWSFDVFGKIFLPLTQK